MRIHNHNYKTLTILTILFFASFTAASSQELTLELNAGPSGISYKSVMGDGTLDFGGGIGIGYTFFLNEHLGVQTGFNVHYNAITFELFNKQELQSNEVDDQGSAFEYLVNAEDYEEDQHFYSFSIPLMLQYRTGISDRTAVYLGFGGKVLFPAEQQFDASASTLAVSGFYPDLNLEIDDLPSHGFGAVSHWDKQSSVSLKPSILLSIEGGLSFKLRDYLRLYTGIYADYGLTDLQEDGNHMNLVSYSPQGVEMITANGVLATQDVVDKSRYLSAGIQVKLGFDFSKKSRPREPEEMEVAVKEVVETEQPTPFEETKPTEIVTSAKPELTTAERSFIELPLIIGHINQSTLTREVENRLDILVKMAENKPNVNLNITGHTCDLGPEVLNKQIGLERAESVATYLKEKGISDTRLHVGTMGETQPLLPNTSVENRIKNRRVEIKVSTMK